jgi:hypothetical protein
LIRAAILLLISAILPVAEAQTPDPRADVVRAAQLEQQTLSGGARQQESAAKTRQRELERLFTARFNELVKALKEFSDRYRAGHGAIWPKREAEKVAKAMRRLQEVEKQFH